MRSFEWTTLTMLLLAAACSDDGKRTEQSSDDATSLMDGGTDAEPEPGDDGEPEPGDDGAGDDGADDDGDDDDRDIDGGTPRLDAGLDASRPRSDAGGTTPDAGALLDAVPVGALSAEGSVALCQWIVALEDRTVTDAQRCTQVGARAATSAACVRDRDACLATLGPWDLIAPERCTGYTIPAGLATGCSARTGELKACLGDLTRAVDDAARRATCDNRATGDVELPASCKAIPAPCFDVLDSLPSRDLPQPK